MGLYEALVHAGYPLRRWARLEIAGRDLLPTEGPAIVVANHDSMMDPPALLAACYPVREIRFLAKAELWSSRVVGFVLDRLDQIPLERGGGGAEALGHAVEALDRGEAVGIFPEGGLSRGRSRRAGRGVAELIKARPEVPVVLAAVTGAGDIVRFPKRPRVRVRLMLPDADRDERRDSALAQHLLDQIRAVAPPVTAGRGRRP